jgi:hypothetical protein
MPVASRNTPLKALTLSDRSYNGQAASELLDSKYASAAIACAMVMRRDFCSTGSGSSGHPRMLAWEGGGSSATIVRPFRRTTATSTMAAPWYGRPFSTAVASAHKAATFAPRRVRKTEVSLSGAGRNAGCFILPVVLANQLDDIKKRATNSSSPTASPSACCVTTYTVTRRILSLTNAGSSPSNPRAAYHWSTPSKPAHASRPESPILTEKTRR